MRQSTAHNTTHHHSPNEHTHQWAGAKLTVPQPNLSGHTNYSPGLRRVQKREETRRYPVK